MENIDIIKEIFETTYAEFKQYESYLQQESKKLEADRSNFAKFALENKSNLEEVVEKMFEINEKPALQKNDLVKLQNRLINMYDIVKDVIDIPKEVREEINSLPKPRMSYKIEDDRAVEINKDMNNEIRKFVKDNNMAFVKKIIESQSKKG